VPEADVHVLVCQRVSHDNANTGHCGCCSVLHQRDGGGNNKSQAVRPGRASRCRRGQKYGYGISQIIFGPNSVYFHGGAMPGYNSFMGYDPVNDVTLIVWTSLTISLDGNTIMLKMLDQSYTVSPLQ
jgi:CubicO group peptidase (beta-lactamase class C family)